MLLMKAYSVCPHESDEIVRGISTQCRLRKVWHQAEEILWRRMKIGEITTSSATDADFFPNYWRMIQQQHPQTPLPSHPRTK
jgi:hypothetical protein